MTTIGGTIWDIKDKTYTINHNSLHRQHRIPQLQQTIHQQSRLFLEYNTVNQLWLHMYKMAMQNRQQVQSTLWSTVEQPHMYVHHGLHKSSQYNNYQQEVDHNYAQWQTMRSNSMDTNGFTCIMQKDNQSSYHFMCVWRTSTHCINFKARGTRNQTYIWWRTT